MFIDVTLPALVKHFINEMKEEINSEVVLYYIEEVLPGFESELREYVVEYTIGN